MATNPNLPATQEKPRAIVKTGQKVAAMVPTTIEETFRLSQAIASSGMAPRAYGNDANKVMVGILAGLEVGFTPFAALQSIAVIGNNPAIWGDGALALVQASGLLEDMEETDDGHKATCRLVRKGRATPIVKSFDMDDAKKAGLAGKSGPWTQYPARMRQMRARAFALRDGFADVLKGLRIAEEVREYAETVMPAGTHATAPLTTAALIAQAEGDTVEGELLPAADREVPLETPQDHTPDRAPVPSESATVSDGAAEEAADVAPAADAGASPATIYDEVQTLDDMLRTAADIDALAGIWNGSKALRKRLKAEAPNMLAAVTKTRDARQDELDEDDDAVGEKEPELGY